MKATFDLRDGVTILSGGFGLCGVPEKLLMATLRHKVKNLSVVSPKFGDDRYGLAWLLRSKQISKVYVSFLSDSK